MKEKQWQLNLNKYLECHMWIRSCPLDDVNGYHNKHQLHLLECWEKDNKCKYNPLNEHNRLNSSHTKKFHESTTHLSCFSCYISPSLLSLHHPCLFDLFLWMIVGISFTSNKYFGFVMINQRGGRWIQW